jgi:hypothetical protein
MPVETGIHDSFWFKHQDSLDSGLCGMTAICGDIQPMALSRLDRYKVIEDICL